MSEFSHNDEYLQRLHIRFMDRLEAPKVLVTKDRVDFWMIKGFDGLSNLLLDRSSHGKPMSSDQLVQLSRCISALETCLDCNQDQMGNCIDETILLGLFYLTEVVRKRHFELCQGKLTKSEHSSLKTYIGRMKVALTRMKDYNEKSVL